MPIFLFEFIRVEGDTMSMKHCKVGRKLRKFGNFCTRRYKKIWRNHVNNGENKWEKLKWNYSNKMKSGVKED
jgi:hypothetical protein